LSSERFISCFCPSPAGYRFSVNFLSWAFCCPQTFSKRSPPPLVLSVFSLISSRLRVKFFFQHFFSGPSSYLPSFGVYVCVSDVTILSVFYTPRTLLIFFSDYSFFILSRIFLAAGQGFLLSDSPLILSTLFSFSDPLLGLLVFFKSTLLGFPLPEKAFESSATSRKLLFRLFSSDSEYGEGSTFLKSFLPGECSSLQRLF